MTSQEFENYLESIGGLKSGYFNDRPPIVKNLCECDDGWLDLIKNLIDELIAIGWDKEICQIKEKFGGLRFYTNGLPEVGWEIISKYEKLSMEICEICGEPGVLRVGGWYKTLCNKHHEERELEKKK